MKTLHRPVVRLNAATVIVALLLSAFGAASGSFQADAQTKKKHRTRRAIKKSAPAAQAAFAVPVGTELKLRLESAVDTKNSKDGDPFTATVLTPSKYEGATVDGHVAAVKQSGKFTGQTALALAFTRLTQKDGQSATIDGQLVEVYGEKSAKEVDQEGNVKSGGQGKTTAIRSGGGAAVGAAIGALAGGGKGAAIGAIVGGAAGAGSVFITGTNKVKLDRGTELLIRTNK